MPPDTYPCSMHDTRMERIEDAIVKFTDVINDLNRQSASDSQRIIQHDKDLERMQQSGREGTEFARINSEKLNVVISQLTDFKRDVEKRISDNEANIKDIKTLVTALEALVYKAVGGLAVISFLIAYGKTIFTLLSGGK